MSPRKSTELPGPTKCPRLRNPHEFMRTSELTKTLTTRFPRIACINKSKSVYTNHAIQVTRATESWNSIATTGRRWQQDGDQPGAHGRPAQQKQPLESNQSEMRRCSEPISAALRPPQIDVPLPRIPVPFIAEGRGRYKLTSDALNASVFFRRLNPTIS
jgi:hypothetical protein